MGDLENHERRITKLEDCVDEVQKALAKIQGSQGTVEILIKWVVLPLLIIVGGLVGIKVL